MKFYNAFITTIFLTVALFLGSTEESSAQDRSVIQFSGIIIDTDSIGIPGVHLYVPGTGRGTSTNYIGFFSMPTLAGDTIVVSAVGFEKKRIVIPINVEENYTVRIQMNQDITQLPEVTVFPLPTEELFKEAVLALNIPEETNTINYRELYGDKAMEQMLRNTPYDGTLNYRYMQNMQYDRMHQRYGSWSNPLLNPFNWAKFIKSLKKDDDDN
ncbi:carboxypeptidase-like regulatory domain-containing protein [Marinigracilibium pacificum]|uniref:Carboxypeptidase-like regulatory domain-containing protein n=1 Tax=Marinigracilibium pacificum TaxID=2729599 RepID=A0A848IZG2_9BACT|nr:carboxypeptidase-like regulatory domain-containing protein [Marinigracilibium pacificum]NMM48761.1 carboxypeptidase-like regulatory domain-containing protein [Marinigracilibium pacificum]